MRLHSQGTRDGHTLAHSSRKLMRKLVFKAVETDKIDVVPREFLALVRGQPLHFETESNVLGNIHPGKQRVVLEDHGVLTAGHKTGDTIDGNAAGRGRFETRCNVQQGCLAATAVTEDRAELVVWSLEGHIAQRHHGFCVVRIAVDLGQIFDSEVAHAICSAPMTKAEICVPVYRSQYRSKAPPGRWSACRRQSCRCATCFAHR